MNEAACKAALKSLPNLREFQLDQHTKSRAKVLMDFAKELRRERAKGSGGSDE